MDQKDLRELEYRCIQEEPPRCQAACPLHVDARALCRAMAEGDTDKAWGVLKRHMPLPGVLARICDQPCRAACLRGQVGDPIRVGDLERVAALAPEPNVRGLPVPRKDKRVLVAGTGPSGLTAAWDLAKKGWNVTLATGAAQPGGVLLSLPPDRLPPEALAAELARLESMGVTLRADGPVAWDPAAGPPEDMDAAVLALDDPGPLPPPPPGDVDPVTLAVSNGMFICGAAGANPDGDISWVGLMADGRRAAVSVDRFLQGVSATADRRNEGPFETRLFTNIEGVEPEAETPMADPGGYSPGEARAEAARCLDCQCLECVRACAYLAHFKSYPRVYARQIYNNEAIVQGSHTANILVDSCMCCDLCTTVCPEDFPMAETIIEARKSMVRRGKMPPSAFEFALEDMAQANAEGCFLARSAPGREGCEFLFFPGCQLAGSAPDQVAAVYDHLRERHGAGLLLGCCGAPARWAGREDVFEAASAGLREHWEALGRPAVVPACPACLQTLRLALPGASLESLWEFLARTGLPDGPHGAAPTASMAVHDPCTARSEPAMRQGARDLLRALGAATEELPYYAGELARCCGYGGLLYNSNPPLSDDAAKLRANESDADYVTYCAMCRDRLARGGKRIAHVLDLMFAGPGGDDPAARPDPGFAGRRENRALLRARLVREVWGEEDDTVPENGIELHMAPEVAARLEQRRIMPADVRAVIARAEASGRRLTHGDSGHFLAGHKPRAVTFWVEYAPRDDPGGQAFVVHNAWCHRMEIREVKP